MIRNAITYDGTTWTIYVNESSVGSKAAAHITSEGSLYILWDSSSNYPTNGLIDDIQCNPGAPTSAEMSNLIHIRSNSQHSDFLKYFANILCQIVRYL